MYVSNRPWSETEIAAIKEAMYCGYDLAELALKLNRSVSAVNVKAWKLGLTPTRGADTEDGMIQRADAPPGWKVTKERMDELMRGRRFEDVQSRRQPSMVLSRMPRLPSLVATAVC